MSEVLVRLPDRQQLLAVCRSKYGPPDRLGWGPALRLRHDYFNPDDWYEALVAGLVTPGMAWLDVGCGRDLLPNHAALATQLAGRAGRVVGVDPDPNLQQNPFVHERVAMPIADYDGGRAFDLVTLRMVAEHVAEPKRCVRAIAAALRPGGVAVVYTVFRFSPMPLLTTLAPMALRHRVKAFLWRTAKQDTFPTSFKMNTRGRLRQLFAGVGMSEVAFLRLDDCRTFGRFRRLGELELRCRSLCRLVHVPYPEHCLLGVYRLP
jgi:SAM-dependent methyltransferase